MYYIHKKLDMNLYKLYSYYVHATPKNLPKPSLYQRFSTLIAH